MLDVERKCEPGKCPWHAYLKHGQASNGQATSGQAMEVDNILYNTPQEPVYEVWGLMLYEKCNLDSVRIR